MKAPRLVQRGRHEIAIRRVHADACHILRVIARRGHLRSIGAPKLDNVIGAARKDVVSDKLDVENLLRVTDELLNALRGRLVENRHCVIVTRGSDDVIIASFHRKRVDTAGCRLVHGLRHLVAKLCKVSGGGQIARHRALFARTRKFFI